MELRAIQYACSVLAMLVTLNSVNHCSGSEHLGLPYKSL